MWKSDKITFTHKIEYDELLESVLRKEIEYINNSGDERYSIDQADLELFVSDFKYDLEDTVLELIRRRTRVCGKCGCHYSESSNHHPSKCHQEE